MYCSIVPITFPHSFFYCDGKTWKGIEFYFEFHFESDLATCDLKLLVSISIVRQEFPNSTNHLFVIVHIYVFVTWWLIYISCITSIVANLCMMSHGLHSMLKLSESHLISQIFSLHDV